MVSIYIYIYGMTTHTNTDKHNTHTAADMPYTAACAAVPFSGCQSTFSLLHLCAPAGVFFFLFFTSATAVTGIYIHIDIYINTFGEKTMLVNASCPPTPYSWLLGPRSVAAMISDTTSSPIASEIRRNISIGHMWKEEKGKARADGGAGADGRGGQHHRALKTEFNFVTWTIARQHGKASRNRDARRAGRYQVAQQQHGTPDHSRPKQEKKNIKLKKIKNCIARDTVPPIFSCGNTQQQSSSSSSSLNHCVAQQQDMKRSATTRQGEIDDTTSTIQRQRHRVLYPPGLL